MKNLKQKQKESTPVGGMTYEEIGKALGMTKQGVRRIEKRAVRKLLKALNRQIRESNTQSCSKYSFILNDDDRE